MLQGTPCTGSCVHGRCNAAVHKLSPSACECNIGWTGIVCDIPVAQLSASSNHSVSSPLASETWQFLLVHRATRCDLFQRYILALGSDGRPRFLRSAKHPAIRLILSRQEHSMRFVQLHSPAPCSVACRFRKLQNSFARTVVRRCLCVLLQRQRSHRVASHHKPDVRSERPRPLARLRRRLRQDWRKHLGV